VEWECEGRGREREGRGGHGVASNGHTGKIATKRNVLGLLWHARGGYRPDPYIFIKVFILSRATFASQIVCLYIAPFRSYTGSTLKKSQ